MKGLIYRTLIATMMFVTIFVSNAFTEEGVLELYAVKKVFPTQYISDVKSFTGTIILPEYLEVIKGANFSSKNKAAIILDNEIVCTYRTKHLKHHRFRGSKHKYKFHHCNKGHGLGEEIEVQRSVELKLIKVR